ncbi:MAG: RagB/SusD family nutrient uptake outer membrane protein, partial [Bacteroidales bacterium]|nr:RagB/SusD family nutrient uptake outer membrane protein [Bacteroidales bacterium]
AKALAAAEDIINNGPYKLYTNDEWVASWSKQWGSESIFELAMLGGENALSGTSSLGAYYARAGHFNNNMGSYVASTGFLNRLGEDPTDIRWGVMDYDETSKTRMGCCYKYLGGVANEKGAFPGDGSDKPTYAVNIKVIRLSEIHLIAAEAALRQATPDKAAAVKYLNNIRKRSPGLAPATEATISLDMILDEKSKELYGEGHRFWDMIRCNKTMTFDDELGGIYTVHRESTVDRTHPKTLLPIFQSEINANPEIEKQQNPGY